MKEIGVEKKWTKSEALEKFIIERVLGDVRFAYDPITCTCVYDHAVNGGCAIGCLIPSEIAVGLQQNMSVGAMNERDHHAISQYLEDEDSLFWRELQLAHDKLAQHVGNAETFPNAYGSFQYHLYEATRISTREEIAK